jgi:hypothetical protein
MAEALADLHHFKVARLRMATFIPHSGSVPTVVNPNSTNAAEARNTSGAPKVPVPRIDAI